MLEKDTGKSLNMPVHEQDRQRC